MPKRGADKPLDYDNWDAPDEPIKFDVFEKADDATLKARNILIAKRRSDQPVTQSKRGLFKSLDAFGSSQPTESVSPSLNLEPKNDVYLSKLAILNKDASAWISKHVSEDPYCILTPIFDDYAKHLSSIKLCSIETVSEKPQTQPAATTSCSSSLAESDTPKAIPSSLQTSASLVAPKNGFTFKFQSTPSSEPSTTSKPPIFSFGLTSATTSDNSISKPPIFSFTAAPVKPAEDPIPASTTRAVLDEGNDEEYTPPKPEVKEIKEEGSVYTVRCKLFYKRADQWAERGLGNLYIIPSTDEKFQLLVRADTNLGNILLNIMVTKDIPMQIQKNNITFACVPSPPIPGTTKTIEDKEGFSPPRPVPMLIRVKSPEAAESLLAEIDKHRGKKSN